jgi:hypothetical protein
MAIKNPDGSDYKLSGGVQQYKPNSSEMDLFNTWDQEMIRMTGMPVEYYEYMPQANTIDPVFLEDRGALWNQTPMCLMALYDRGPQMNHRDMFGYGGPDEVMFNMNLKYVMDTLGHLPRLGSRLFTPHLRENWKIDQLNVAEFQLWGRIRLQVMCKKWQENNVNPSGVKDTPHFKLDDI